MDGDGHLKGWDRQRQKFEEIVRAGERTPAKVEGVDACRTDFVLVSEAQSSDGLTGYLNISIPDPPVVDVGTGDIIYLTRGRSPGRSYAGFSYNYQDDVRYPRLKADYLRSPAEDLTLTAGDGSLNLTATDCEFSDGTNTFSMTDIGNILLSDGGELTISSGAVTVGADGIYTIDTEGDGATDDLDAINGGTAGQVIVISAEHTARTVVVKHDAVVGGEIFTQDGEDITLDDDDKRVMLLCDTLGASCWWYVISEPPAAKELADLSDVGDTTATDGNVLRADGDSWESAALDAGDVTYTPAVATDWDGDADPGDLDDAVDQLAERVDDLEGAGGSDEKVKVSANDTTADYLLNKLAAGAGITVTETNDGGDEDATIAVDADNIPFTPTTATDWDGDADPGDVDDALDQLAERVDDLEGAGGGVHDVVIVADEKADGTKGGTFTQGAWRTRDVNAERYDSANICAIAANQITLQAGTYYFFISCPALDVDAHQARLYNATDTAVIEYGTTEVTNANFTNRSIITGYFTIAAAKALEIQHYGTSTKADKGFGDAASFGVGEVYTEGTFIRIAS